MTASNSDMRNICYVIIGGLFLFISTLSAETKKVCVSGNWEIVNITPEEARNKAIEEAKIHALQKAGISELLSVVNTGTVSDRLNCFVSSSYSEFSGEIISYKVLKEQILTEGKHIHTFEWLEFDRLKNEYFYPTFLKKKIYNLPDAFTIRTEVE